MATRTRRPLSDEGRAEVVLAIRELRSRIDRLSRSLNGARRRLDALLEIVPDDEP